MWPTHASFIVIIIVISTFTIICVLFCSYVLGMDNINSSMVNSHLEQFADQGFHYGRNWLKEQVSQFIMAE